MTISWPISLGSAMLLQVDDMHMVRCVSIVLGVIVLVLSSTIMILRWSNSRTKREYERLTDGMPLHQTKEGIFTDEEAASLPLPVRSYLSYCGYIGKPKMAAMKISYRNVKFQFSLTGEPLNIDYFQHNLATEPQRIAYIKSFKFGIPFEGLDSYRDGHATMKGVFARFATVFEQSGEPLDQAALATWLAECLLVPSAAFSPFITWVDIDASHAGAMIDYHGMRASGVFEFDGSGALRSFTTDDRPFVTDDGQVRNLQWSMQCDGYVLHDGIRKPTAFRAIWHHQDHDFVYFTSNHGLVEFL